MQIERGIAMATFLDENGLSHLWAKIKAYVSNAINSVSAGASSAIKQMQWQKYADKGTIGTTTIIGDHTYMDIPSATATEAGLLSAADKQKLDGIEDFTGASSSEGGAAGLVPAPAFGDLGAVLAGNGKWEALGLSWNAGIVLNLGDMEKRCIIPAADAESSGLMSYRDKAKLDGFQEASSYALKSDLVAVYKYKGSVAASSGLPTTGQSKGDVYNIEAASAYGPAGTNVAWDGAKWDALGGLFEVEAITNARIDEICV